MINVSEYDCENIPTTEYNEYVYQKQNKIIRWGKSLLNIVKNVVSYPIVIITNPVNNDKEVRNFV